MSEKIKITIVMDDEKLNIRSTSSSGSSVIVTHDSSTTVMSTLLKNELISGSFCGGRGDCGRCKIQFIEGTTMPTPLERSVMEPEELRQGYRLACLAKPKDNCVIKLALEDTPKIDIVSDMIAVTEKNDYNSQQNIRTANRKSDVTKSSVIGNDFNKQDVKKSCVMKSSVVQPENRFSCQNHGEDMIIAVDLGTTTIAMQLMGMESGRIIDTYCEMNPQRRYGSDVLSRMKASCDGSREVLQQLVVQVLERGVARFEQCLSKEECVRAMCIAGNTTMEHLLMGYDVSSLGRSPFIPVEIGLQEYMHSDFTFPVWLVPCISAFVGGDIVAGLYALGMLPKTQRSREQKRNGEGNADREENGKHATLLIDLGTNGEMAITDGTRMVVTATAAGPAFEGGAGAGVIGSDMIASTASLLKQEILDETGLLTDPYFTEGVTVGDPAVRLCNKDIRDLQMAKAAVRAGIEILWRQMGEPATLHVYLAGGFGYYLDVEAAFSIGLLPAHMRGQVEAVGNTSLAGAFMIGCDLWKHKTDKALLEKSLSSIVKINLAEQEAFEKLYVRYMNLGES
ncbi:MAG: ASKHA domain-containing protein [Lachnospiraceae bacterium]|nr:ASKHA domain-containing protein [Lachnospiraceae bacterium]